MSDNADQQRPEFVLVVSPPALPRVAKQVEIVAYEFFTIVQKGSIESGTPRPGLSREQLAQLPREVQTAVETESLAAWRQAVATMPSAQVESILDIIDKADAEIRIRYELPSSSSREEIRAVQALLDKVEEDIKNGQEE